ncbi:MAG: NUDIX domain-containing protein [Actinomycetota bacterium]|nr:NUDIX domain-containing protein [Actinomycetota bacterium]
MVGDATMSGPEMLDVVDPATGRVVATRTRAEVHARGDWHRVFHCLVVRPGAGSVVLQRRSRTKSAFAGLLDLSVTGHLSAGEEPLDGVREYAEELGVAVDPASLVPLGTRLLADDAGEGRNREMVHVYLSPDDRALDTYRPAPGEVDELVEVTVDGLDHLLEHPDRTADATAWAPGDAIRPVRIDRSDLVDGASGYWVLLAAMARRHLDGGGRLAI